MSAQPLDRSAAARQAPPLRPDTRDARAARHWPLRRVFGVGASVAALLIVIAIAAGGLALVRLTDARSTLLDEVIPALEAGQSLSVALLNQETGVRGFVMTGNEEFLEPYRGGLVTEQNAVATLRRLDTAAGLGRLGADLDAVEGAVQGWRTGYAEPAIAAARTTPAAPVDLDRGRVLFDDVRASTIVLQNDLWAEQVAARGRVDDAARFLLVVGIAIAAVLAGFLVAGGIGLRRGVLRPVSHLAAEVRQVVSGDVQQTIRATGPREIVELGEDVEAMRVRILCELDTLQQVNRRLDEQTRDLERSNRDLEQFAYAASHDLQEPLRKVSSFCTLLQRRYSGKLDERADQYIGFAVDGAQRMQQLINDLLSFSRVGRTTAEFEPVDMEEVARSAAAQLDGAREEAGGEVEIGELPTVHGDPVLLRQLLVNLIGNALKFRREGVPPVVGVTAAPIRGGGWEVSVRDNGIGIEPEYAEKVFVIFQRLHGRDTCPGTGIGLALAKKIVEFHGGRIRVDVDAPGPGTTVRFTLPAAIPDIAPDSDPEEKSS